MANKFTLADKLIPVLDAIYKQESKTNMLDAPEGLVRQGMDAKTVSIAKMALQGLGDYARDTGFTRGDITLEWESFTFTQDRGRTFHIDAMDDEETLGVVMASVVGEFMRIHVIPELDAYRFSEYASDPDIGKGTAGTPTAANILDLIDAGGLAMDNAEVSEEDRILFVSPSTYALMKAANDKKHVLFPSESENRNFMTYDGMEVVKVPQGRFYTKLTMNAGGDGGYTKDSTDGKDINFIIIQKSAVFQLVKHAKPRLFSPDVNQDADAYKVDYRVYHDAWVYPQKAKGVYLHNKA